MTCEQNLNTPQQFSSTVRTDRVAVQGIAFEVCKKSLEEIRAIIAGQQAKLLARKSQLEEEYPPASDDLLDTMVSHQ